MKILIGSMVRATWMLDEFCQSLATLDIGSHRVDRVFVDDSPDGLPFSPFYKTLSAVDCFAESNISSRDVKNRPALYQHLKTNFQQLLAYARAGDYDALLMVDADTLVAPWLLSFLLLHDKPMVGTVLHTDCHVLGNLGISPWRPHGHINVLTRDRQSGSYQTVHHYPTDGVHSYAVVGGCYLLNRAVLEGVTDYPLPRGMSEDLAFCQAVHDAGFSIWCDFSVNAVHVMQPRFLAEAMTIYRRWLPMSEVSDDPSPAGDSGVHDESGTRRIVTRRRNAAGRFVRAIGVDAPERP